MNRLRFNFSECKSDVSLQRPILQPLCKSLSSGRSCDTGKITGVPVNSKKCVSVGACVGACPSEAFSLSGFDVDAHI
ncbi:MAG: hypothetical protein Q9M89_06115 [Persephonella sp.]|nr:hypothetical protein [Persephonella sp.]